MGYYISIGEEDFFLPKYNFDAAYRKCIELNDRDDLKSGGGGEFILPNGEKLQYGAPRPDGMDYHPMKWFSWMEPNYPAELKTLDDILVSLGFEVNHDSVGNIVGLSYDNKIGDEYHFLEAIAPFVRDGSYIIWMGEDHYTWKNEFKDGKMFKREATIIWE